MRFCSGSVPERVYEGADIQGGVQNIQLTSHDQINAVQTAHNAYSYLESYLKKDQTQKSMWHLLSFWEG